MLRPVLADELERALNASSPLDTVLLLCRAWAQTPSTRVARLARGFARLIPSESVPGANPRARELAWQERAAQAQPGELPSLLATPWSKSPKDAAARLAAFARIGPDPRVVGALLELDSGSRYPSAAGHRFWQDVYELLLSWGSVEAAARVPRDVSASDHTSPWSAARYQGIFEPLAQRWASRWPKELPLSPREVELLDALEARLAPTQELTRQLLAEVHAAPGEDTPRLVFADALTEQGDARGEFISLQFAHDAGELTLARREHVQRLLSASGRAWFDGLDAQVAPLAVFHKGFLREVRLNTRTPDASLAAWSTIEVLDVGGIAVALSSFLQQPRLAGVHSLRNVRGPTFAELARNLGERRFELVELTQLGAREPRPPKWSTSTLRLLAAQSEAVWWFEGAGLRERVGALALPVAGNPEAVGNTVRALTELGVQALELASQAPSWPMVWHGDWKLRFSGPALSVLELSLGDEVLSGLEAALSSLAPKQLRAVQVRTVLRRGPAWREQAEALVRRALASQRGVRELAFELVKPEPLPVRGFVHEGR